MPGGGDLKAVRAAVAQFTGAYAIAVISTREPGRIVGARAGSPLVVGLRGRPFSGLDAAALLTVTQRVIYLDEGDVADVPRIVRDLRCAASGSSVRSSPSRRRVASSSSAPTGTSCRRKFSNSRVRRRHARRCHRDRAGAIRREGARRARRGRRRAGARPDQPLRGAGGEILGREPCTRALPGRDRERVPLSRHRAQSEAARDRRLAVRRDRGHAGGTQARAGARSACSRSATSRPRRWSGRRSGLSHARRHRGGRGIDEGVHHAAHRAIPVCDGTREGSRATVGR